MPSSNIKWCVNTRKALKPDTFRNFLLYIFKMFPEAQAKLLANSFIGELGRKYLRTDHGFTSRDMDTVQCIWTSPLAENRQFTKLQRFVPDQTTNSMVPNKWMTKICQAFTNITIQFICLGILINVTL